MLPTVSPGRNSSNCRGPLHFPFYDDDLADRMAEEVEEFLTGARSEAEPDRVLARVMFTDIVDSTSRAAQLGDRRWRELRERHDQTVRQQIGRFRGHEIKSLGDGFLATFDGPARAVRCAAAIAETVQPLGIVVRAGLHTGEIELQRDDIGGIAVHIQPGWPLWPSLARRSCRAQCAISSPAPDCVFRTGACTRCAAYPRKCTSTMCSL